MFNLFKKKDPGIRIIDKIVMTQSAKWNALIDQWRKNNDTVFVFWFDETMRQAETFFLKENITAINFYLAKTIQLSQLKGKEIIFTEHYPLPQKEKELFEGLQLGEVQIWSAMDEPLFKEFGSEKIIQMMKQLGMKEDQVIEHNMIGKAIHNSQEKISKKVILDQMSSSQEEWMRKNWTNS